MKRIYNFVFVLIFIFIGCQNNSINTEDNNYNIINCPTEIKNRAFSFAELYCESDTEYSWGGQDPCRTIKIDCSGLVIMCYKYAMVDTKYSLLKSDMTASYMYKYASEVTTNPEHGDLIFMGEIGTDKVTHISIYDREENGEIYFIDSTDNGVVNGVSERHYPKDSEKFKSFGIMKLKY